MKRAPAPKLSAAQRSAEKHRQAELILLRSNVGLVKKGLQHYPEALAAKFVTQMKQMGIIGDDGEVIVPDGNECVAFSPLMKRARFQGGMAQPVGVGEEATGSKDQDTGGSDDGAEKADVKAEAADDEHDPSAQDELSTGYWKLSSHSVAQLQK